MERIARAILVAALLGGCSTMPTAPGALVLPGTGKNLERFRGDDYRCRQYAYVQIGGISPARSQIQSGVTSAAVGAGLGAAAGAAIGGGSGAAVGAGAGLAAGGLSGVAAAEESGRSAQERYDIHYIQCMYAEGHRVPVYGNFLPERPREPAPTVVPPPPPPGAPPPPPAR